MFTFIIVLYYFYILLINFFFFLEVNGKVQSLEEIESRLRMSGGQQNGFSSPHSNVQFHEELKMKKMQNMKVGVIVYTIIINSYFE